MKKWLPYIISLFLGVAIMTLFFSAKKKNNRQLDERITLKRTDKNPYGSWVAFQTLGDFFPEAHISVNRYEPGYWDSLSNYAENQVLIIVTGRFEADKKELQRISRFIQNGNHVFISAQYLSAAMDEFIDCGSSAYDMSIQSVQDLDPGMKLTLAAPPYEADETFGYPGRGFDSYFSRIDTLTTDILGYDLKGRPNFIRLQAGKGYLYVQLEPFALTNYFLLHKSNIRYYEKLMSLLPRDAGQVVWDEYYLGKRESRPPSEKKNWFTVLMSMPNEEGKRSFQAAFLLLIGLLLLYVFMEMRRKQRPIPVITRPRNDSLDFVSTIGRLYYDKGDHKNLSRKMSSYFLEYVRNKFKMPTGTLDDEFVKNLSFKSGVREEELHSIVTFIRYAEDAPSISSRQLMNFHYQLESFYLKA